MTARLPECPRCGYDLQGQIAAWHPAGDTQPDAACPTTGTCSECGLDFEWRFILVEGLASPKWFFETTRSRLVQSVIRTWVHSLRPPKFWRDVRLEVTPRIWRLAIYVIGPLLASVLIHALIFLVIRALWYWAHSTRAARFSVKQYPTPLGELHLAFRDFMHESMAQTGMFRQLLWPAIAVAMIIMPPTVLLCLPWTRARSKVRVTHIVRAFVYALAPIAALYGISLVVNMAASLYQLRSNYAWAEPWFAPLDPFVPARNYGLGFAMPYHWLLLIWWLIYWWCVLKHGWRMNDHRKVFIALAIPALLASIILACFVPGAFTWAV